MEFLSSQFSVIRGIKGFKRVYEDALRYRYMITEKALEKARILVFWEKHGLVTTLEAFPNVKQRTLFLWKQQWKEGGKKPEALNEKSRAPKTRRVRTWPAHVVEVIRKLREEHPNLGKEKIYPALLRCCEAQNLPCPKPSTIGRILFDLGGLRTFPKKITHFGKVKPIKRKKVLRKPKGLIALYPGHIVSFDTFEEHQEGRRRYILTATDVHTRISLAWATHSHASRAAQEFFDRVKLIFPFPFTSILTDNGSEFAKHFSEEIQKRHLLHYHTYPRTPKMNAHTERFNRTVQEEFSDFRKQLLFNDLDAFNRKLLDYLLWYNTDRVHWAFGNKRSPIQFLTETVSVNSHLSQECKDGWTYTGAFIRLDFVV